MDTLRYGFTDAATMARRNVIKIRRVPELLVPIVISPLIFILLFAYVFGSAVDVGDGSYREFIVSGAFAMTLTWGGNITAAALAENIKKGITDRFRSLPMSRAAVLLGRTTSDVIYNVISLTVMGVAGLVVGWRINTSISEALVGFGLLLLFAYAFSWVMAYVGVLFPNPEVISSAGMMVIFPVTFIANTFVPTNGFPAPLRVFAEWNPVSAVTHAARVQFGNVPDGLPPSAAWSMQHPGIYTALWAIAMMAIFAPLAVRRYQKIGDRS